VFVDVFVDVFVLGQPEAGSSGGRTAGGRVRGKCIWTNKNGPET